MIIDNINSMAELAKVNAINRTMKDYAKKNVMVYLGYFSSMVDDKIGSEKIIHMMVWPQIKLGTV